VVVLLCNVLRIAVVWIDTPRGLLLLVLDREDFYVLMLHIMPFLDVVVEEYFAPKNPR
jgi:hypothetical protein